ncbi:MAG: MBL fold metallo-hydrolase [Ruminococcaceae bacterium]|nr:MBL fold metallo-hydrolase [Oscillospiraceae bacterium]
MNEIQILDMRVHPGDAAFLLDDGETTVLYDTGFGFTGFGVAENIKNYLGDRPLDYIFLTHSHYDHALGSAYVLRYYPDAKVVAGEHTAQVFQRDGAKRVMKDLDAKHAATCGVTDYPFLGDELRVDIQVRDGDIIKAGEMEFEVLWLPGHTNCSVGFYCREKELLLSTESIGVYDGERLILPAILVGCKAALSSIDRVCALPIKKLVLPHRGLLNAQHTEFFLSHCKEATLTAIDFILTRLQAGKCNEEIVQDFVDAFWHGSVQVKYPIAAIRLNTGIMIDLVRKEMLS